MNLWTHIDWGGVFSSLDYPMTNDRKPIIIGLDSCAMEAVLVESDKAWGHLNQTGPDQLPSSGQYKKVPTRSTYQARGRSTQARKWLGT